MRKVRTLLIIGLWVAILPYLGFPHSWKNVLFTISGLGLMYLGYLLKKEHESNNPQESEEEAFDNFSENADFSEDDLVEEPVSEESSNRESLNE